MFHGASAAHVAVVHPLSDLDLHVKGQLVGGALCDVVHMAARGPKEVFGALEDGEFFARQKPRPHQALGRGHAVQVFADPIQRLQIAQPALGLFHIGFQHIALPALALVAFGAFGQFGVNKLAPCGAKQVRPKLVVQLCCKGCIARDIAVFQKGGADGDILAPKTQAVFDGAA